MIFWCVTFAVLSALFVPFFPLAPDLPHYSGSWWPGFYFVLACYLMFLGGYAIRSYATRGSETERIRSLTLSRDTTSESTRLYPDVSNLYLGLLAVWALIGFGIVVLQVQMTMGFGPYLALIAQGSKAVEAARGATVQIDSSQGGLPGFIKVWNQNCTSSVLILIFLLAEGRKIKGLIAKFFVALIGLSYIGRNLLTMDRLALLALVPAVYFLWSVSGWKARRSLLIVGAIVFALAEMQSLRRSSENGALGFYVLYVQSGMANTNMMIETLRGGHTYGVASLFSALYWLLKSFGVYIISGDIQYDFLWNDAHNSFGLLFLDFDWLGPLLLLPAGAMAQKLDSKPLYRGDSRDWKAHLRLRLRALIAYVALSSIFVPAYLGPEFPLTVMGLIVAAWIEGRYPDFCFNRIKRVWARRRPLAPAATPAFDYGASRNW